MEREGRKKTEGGEMEKVKMEKETVKAGEKANNLC